MNKHTLVATLYRELQSVKAERQAAQTDAATGMARAALKRFQVARMMRTHADLLMAPASHAAARFFLDDLYGAEDMTQRDADIERVIPMMERLLPVPALETITEAIMLDALSESLDAVMASRLGEKFDEADYIVAYRESTLRADRERQLAYVESTGYSLCNLVRVRLVGTTLKLMRKPARLANLDKLHDFLERGFNAFSIMPDPKAFVVTVVTREKTIMENLYAGRTQPFSLIQE